MIGSKNLYKPWRQWVLGWIPFWLASAVVVWGYAMPLSRVPERVARCGDFLLHVGPFFILFFISAHAFLGSEREWLRDRARDWALAYGILLGSLTEWLQNFSPGRVCDFNDWAANVVGGALGWLIFGVIGNEIFGNGPEKTTASQTAAEGIE